MMKNEIFENPQTTLDIVVKLKEKNKNKKFKETLNKLKELVAKDLKELYSLTYTMPKDFIYLSEFYELLNRLIQNYSLLMNLIYGKESIYFYTYGDSYLIYLFGAVSENMAKAINKAILDYNKIKDS